MNEITLEKVKNIIDDIKSDKEWLIKIKSEYYKGVCSGLDTLLEHLGDVDCYEKGEWKWL